MQLSDIIHANAQLKKANKNPIYPIKILSNIVVNPLNHILEYSLQKQELNPNVLIGNYDNILQEVMDDAHPAALIIVFWEICNITNDFISQMMCMNETEQQSIIDNIKNDLTLFFRHLSRSSFVLMNQFTSLLFKEELHPDANHKLINIVYEVNQFIKEHAPKNVKLIPLDEIICSLGIARTFNKKFYFLAKALYTTQFYQSYVDCITPMILAAQGRRKKVVIFDCDNTLWKGTVGEDVFKHILMSSNSKEGAPFATVQQWAVNLVDKGVLIALCSKNNAEEIDAVFEHHPDCILKEDHITLKAVNWDDKANNIRKIAQQLNVGLDSIIFVDDSDFEIHQVQHALPEVTLFQVPKNIDDYPFLFQSQVLSWFQFDVTAEDSSKTQFYKNQFLREAEEGRATNLSEYLRLLSLKLTIFLDNFHHLKRIMQIVQKTNQFNAAMVRHNEAEIEMFLTSSYHRVWTFHLADRFGDYGVTGLAIVKIHNTTAIFINFLMSCRVIGRQVEHAFIYHIANDLLKQGILNVECHYLPSSKNTLVKTFFNKIGMKYKEKKDEYEIYHLDLRHLQYEDTSFIEIYYETEIEPAIC